MIEVSHTRWVSGFSGSNILALAYVAMVTFSLM